MDIVVPKVSLRAEQKPPDAKPDAKLNGPTPDSDNHQEAFVAFDKRDETQIVEVLKGNYLDEYVFEFCRRHRTQNGGRPECGCTDTVVSLSLVGILEASRSYGGIQIPLNKVVIQHSDEQVQVMVEAFDTKTGSSRVGVACQSKKFQLRSGAVVEDEFYLQKVVAKSQRNALRQLLPVSLLKNWVEQHRKGNGRAVLPPAEPAKPPAPLNGQAQDVLPKTVNGNGQSSANGSNGTPRKGYPSVPQIKRLLAIGYSHKVSREDVLAVVERVAGVKELADIPSRALYERVCGELEKYRDGVPF